MLQNVSENVRVKAALKGKMSGEIVWKQRVILSLQQNQTVQSALVGLQSHMPSFLMHKDTTLTSFYSYASISSLYFNEICSDMLKAEVFHSKSLVYQAISFHFCEIFKKFQNLKKKKKSWT